MLYDIPITLKSNGWHLGWDSVEKACKGLGQEMFGELYRPDKIIALGRGAVIPARILSACVGGQIHYLGIKSYEAGQQSDLKVYQDLEATDLNRESTLIVDDIWDTGATMRYALQRWPLAATACLVSKEPIGKTLLNFVGVELAGGWVHFPWER